eukprot:3803521-Lingulodinium_polyedra.AAC.1
MPLLKPRQQSTWHHLQARQLLLLALSIDGPLEEVLDVGVFVLKVIGNLSRDTREHAKGMCEEVHGNAIAAVAADEVPHAAVQGLGILVVRLRLLAIDDLGHSPPQ